MVALHEVESQIDETIAQAGQAFETESSARYESFSQNVEQLDSLAREFFQAKLEDHIWPVINKLEEGEVLTTAEQDMLEMMVVGDAKYYVKSENDVENWKAELERLLREIEQIQSDGLENLDPLMQLRALCREAMRILPDLTFYFQERERVHKFEKAIQGAIDRDTRRELANLIKDMLASDEI